MIRPESRFAPRWRPLALGLAIGLVPLAPAPAAAAFDLPPLDRIVHYQPRQPLQVFTADGVDIGQFGSERRQYVPLSQTPRLMQDAVLAVEDWRFREHSGVDPRGMARAALALLTGGMRQGASTITQQLVRTMLLTQQFTAERKAKEILLALKVEQALSKDRILEIYLNEIFLGQRAYGFAAAAQTYFGKPMNRLSLAETAMLAGLPQNPHYANPVMSLDRAVARQRIVLARMRAVGVITEAQHQAALAEKLAIRPPGQQDLQAGHVAEMARRMVVERFGSEAYTAGLRVYTSLRAADQQAAHAAVRRGLLAYDRRGPWRGPEDQETLPPGDGPQLEQAAARALKEHRDDEQLRAAIVLAASPRELRVQLTSGERLALTGEALRWAQPALAPKAAPPLKIQRGSIVRVTDAGKGWTLAQWPAAQSGLVAMDTRSGRIRALVGGFDFARQPLNHVTQAWRQPGSAFKPFLYSAALESRVMPATRVDDLPVVVGSWAPQNSDGQYDGAVGLREALARSKNMVSIRLLQHVGLADARSWAGRFGLDPVRQPENLTLALGAGSVTPLQMVQGYATLANGGWRVAPVLVERITDAQGKLLFEAPPAPVLAEDQRAIPERNAFVMNRLLNEVTRTGTAARAQAQLRRPDVYGKTGTTNEAVDAWFAGYHPSLAAVVWMGHDEPRSLGERESGGGLALPIWLEYMAQALKGVPVAEIPPTPPGVIREGAEWHYAEWQSGGWVLALRAEGGAVYATPPDVAIMPTPLPADPAGSVP